jgi:hypothetical protein
MTAVRVQIEVTSQHPCQIPVVGTFEAGETKIIDDVTLQLFEMNYGYKLGAGRFASWVDCTARLIYPEVEVVPEETEEV